MNARMKYARPRFTFALTLLALALATAMPPYAQTTWYVGDNAVNAPGPSDSSVGDPDEDDSMHHPFDAIQEAIDTSINGGTVAVARAEASI